MNPPRLKITCALAIMTILINGAWASEVVTKQMPTTKERIPQVIMKDVPLRDAIKNLARQAQLNYILDPHIVAEDGIFPKEPTVSFRWQNITAEEALQKVLKDHQLKMVLNPATSIARIMPTNVVVQPVPVGQLGRDKMKPEPTDTDRRRSSFGCDQEHRQTEWSKCLVRS